jgi:hypothetical protein
MELAGSHLALILHDPELRHTVAKDENRRGSAHASRPEIDLRLRLTRAVRSVASRVRHASGLWTLSADAAHGSHRIGIDSNDGSPGGSAPRPGARRRHSPGRS